MTDTMKIVGSCTFHLVHPGHQEAFRNNLLCGNECIVVMQDNSTAWLNPTQVKTRLSPT